MTAVWLSLHIPDGVHPPVKKTDKKKKLSQMPLHFHIIFSHRCYEGERSVKSSEANSCGYTLGKRSTHWTLNKSIKAFGSILFLPVCYNHSTWSTASSSRDSQWELGKSGQPLHCEPSYSRDLLRVRSELRWVWLRSALYSRDHYICLRRLVEWDSFGWSGVRHTPFREFIKTKRKWRVVRDREGVSETRRETHTFKMIRLVRDFKTPVSINIILFMICLAARRNERKKRLALGHFCEDFYDKEEKT